MILLAAALLLHVGVADDTTLRLASTGTGDEPVRWTLDGDDVAWTDDGSAAHVLVAAGEHALWATTESGRAWHVLARADAPGDGQAMYVPAWSASHPEAPDGTRAPLLPLALVLAAVGALASRRSLLEALRRRRHA